MFRDLKEYQDIQKLYEEQVSKPENLEEMGPLGSMPKLSGREKAQKMAKERIAKKKAAETKTVTPMSTSGAKITTNQKQSREIASKNKDVELNKFSRTKTYGADEKGVKLVPGSKVGQKVNRSTVFTKADRDITLGGKKFKKGEKLGVLTRNQRRKYDLMTAPKQEVKVDPPKDPTPPTPPTPPQPTENKGKLRGGQGGRPLGDTTKRQGGTVKSGVTLFKKGDDAKKFTDKTGFASKVDSVKGKDPKPEKRPMGRSYAKRRKMAASRMEEYDAYDLVLEYLLSSEQVTTIEEANYVMTEMDAETIQGIVEEQKKNSMKDF